MKITNKNQNLTPSEKRIAAIVERMEKRSDKFEEEITKQLNKRKRGITDILLYGVFLLAFGFLIKDYFLPKKTDYEPIFGEEFYLGSNSRLKNLLEAIEKANKNKRYRKTTDIELKQNNRIHKNLLTVYFLEKIAKKLKISTINQAKQELKSTEEMIKWYSAKGGEEKRKRIEELKRESLERLIKYFKLMEAFKSFDLKKEEESFLKKMSQEKTSY